MVGLLQNPVRCGWCRGDPLYEHYHDQEWGLPLADNTRLFEFLCLEGAQAGLSWITILRKRDQYVSVMDRFDPQKVARYSEDRQEQLLLDPGIVRNRAKMKSMVNNARCVLDMAEAGTSLSDHLWHFVDGEPLVNHFTHSDQVPSQTHVSARLSSDLKARGFTFVGPTICYALMQATGMVNDHLVQCFRHLECQGVE